jgi:hypothetical protein
MDTPVADILTKPLGPKKFRQHANRMLQGQVYPQGGASMTEQEESKTEDKMNQHPGALSLVWDVPLMVSQLGLVLVLVHGRTL